MSHARHVSWALVDQALVSGVNFLTGILLARFLGLEGYGQFVLLYAVLLYANSIQGALMIAPMMSIYPKLDKGERERYLGGAFSLQILLALMLSLLLVALACALDFFRPDWHLMNYIFPLGAIVVFFQLQDWLRRYYFSDFRPLHALIVDVVGYGGQLAGVGAFCLAENIAVDTALWVIAGSSAVGFAVGWGRERLAFRPHEATRVLRLNYAMARDFFLSGQLQWAGSQGVLMIAGSFLGVAASGGIRAAQNVVSPLNVLYQAMENVIPVKAAHEYMQNNIAGLVRYLGKVSMLGGSAILLACLMMSLFSEQLIQLLYGNEYVKYAELVIWQAGYMLLGFYLRQAIYFHRAMNSTSVLVFATLVAASSSIAVAFLLIPLWGERGLMIALVLSQCLGLWLAGREVYKVIQRCQ